MTSSKNFSLTHILFSESNFLLENVSRVLQFVSHRAKNNVAEWTWVEVNDKHTHTHTQQLESGPKRAILLGGGPVLFHSQPILAALSLSKLSQTSGQKMCQDSQNSFSVKALTICVNQTFWKTLRKHSFV